MRARSPDVEGVVERDGVRLGYEVFGSAEPSVLLMPTWTIIHSRFWKMQVPYLARHHRVITYDGPGNGRSDRVTDPSRYAADSYAADAAAVLDACRAATAIVVGVSLGAEYATRLANLHPDRVSAVVLVGSALSLVAPHPARAAISDRFFEPYPPEARGWDKYNAAYWHDHYHDFVEFFFDEVFSEPHSTKPREDAVSWALETGPVVLEAGERRPASGIEDATALAGLCCPVLVIHGTGDRILPYEVGVEAARITAGPLATLEGSGHLPNVRDPVRFNLLLRAFIEQVAA